MERNRQTFISNTLSAESTNKSVTVNALSNRCLEETAKKSEATKPLKAEIRRLKSEMKVNRSSMLRAVIDGVNENSPEAGIEPWREIEAWRTLLAGLADQIGRAHV